MKNIRGTYVQCQKQKQNNNKKIFDGNVPELSELGKKSKLI